MIILSDMDEVLCSFEQGFLDKWQEKYPDLPYISLENRTQFYIKAQYPQQFRTEIEEIQQSEGFIRNLPPIPGAADALKEMRKLGHEVFICTSPLLPYDFSVREKYEWVDEHLGNEWVKKIILTKDKTLVRGDLLIDDKPDIKGCSAPVWEHVVYDFPYNRNVNGKRRVTWDNWKEILPEVLGA